MSEMFKKRKYNSQILCVSSLVYLLAGLIVIGRNPYLSVLLFIVTIFSILYHHNFKDFNLKVLDWTFGTILLFYLLYIINIKFDLYIFILLVVLMAFRLLDHILFKTKRYGIFSYTHSAWHFLSGLVVVFAMIFI